MPWASRGGTLGETRMGRPVSSQTQCPVKREEQPLSTQHKFRVPRRFPSLQLHHSTFSHRKALQAYITGSTVRGAGIQRW